MRAIPILFVLSAAAWADPFEYELFTINEAKTGYDRWEGAIVFEGAAGDPFPGLLDAASISFTSPYSGAAYEHVTSLASASTDLVTFDLAPARLGDPLLAGTIVPGNRHSWVNYDRPIVDFRDAGGASFLGLFSWNVGGSGGTQFVETGGGFLLREFNHGNDTAPALPAWKLELVGGGEPAPVPEPSTLALLAGAALAWLVRRRAIVSGR